VGGFVLVPRQGPALDAEPGAPTAGDDILAGAPVELTGLSLPLDAFPAPTGDQPIAAPASAAQAFADPASESGEAGEAAARNEDNEGIDGHDDEPHPARSAAPAPRPLAFDLGGISLDLDAGDAADDADASDKGERRGKGSPDIMAPPAMSPASSDKPPRP